MIRRIEIYDKNKVCFIYFFGRINFYYLCIHGGKKIFWGGIHFLDLFSLSWFSLFDVQQYQWFSIQILSTFPLSPTKSSKTNVVEIADVFYLMNFNHLFNFKFNVSFWMKNYLVGLYKRDFLPSYLW